MFDPKHLLWLAEIADQGSLSRAAQKLNVTQPTLTRAVQILEGQVGSKVFERERHGVRPTRIGERLIEVGRDILANRSRAETIASLWRQGFDRELRVGVGPALGASIMGDFFAGLVMNPPRYALFVESATASRLIERLKDGDLDVVLAPEQINLLQDDLVQHNLFQDELAIFAGRENPFSMRREGVKASELEGQTWINVGALSGIFGSTKDVLGHLKVRNAFGTISFTGDLLMAAEIVRRTSALCMMPRHLTIFSDFMTGITPIKFDGELPSRNVVLWSRRTDYNLPDIQHFHEKLRALVARRGL